MPSIYNVTNNADSGAGSFRQALLDANSHLGADTVRFQIPSGRQTIAVASALPAITDAVTIDGTSQPGYAGTPLIVLDGTATPLGSSGLVLTDHTGSTIKGLDIINFSVASTGSFVDSAGINIRNGGGHTIQSNWIGTDGTTAKPNGYAGVLVNNSVNNQIGGTTAAQRNVISGNRGVGVYIANPLSTGNKVQGNYVGTDAAGTGAVPNGAAATSIGGVVISGFGVGGVIPTGNNTVGGAATGAGNLIAFERYAVQVVGSAGNPVACNSLHDNGAAILLDSDFRANDALDADTGGDGRQNQPFVTATNNVSSGGTVVNTNVTGTLSSTPLTQFRIEIFTSPTSGVDAWGNGQGKVLVGSTTVTTDAAGNAAFTVLASPISGQYVTATATNALTGDTSPVSPPLFAPVFDPGTPAPTGKGYALAVMSGPPRVWLYNADGSLRRTFLAYDNSVQSGVHVATADFNNDGVLDVLTGVGPGFAAHVKLFDGASGVLVNEFYAYDPSFSGGVNVAAGDVTGDGTPDIVVSAGPGGGPHVKVFDVKHAQLVASFFAYDTGFHGGVNIAAGDVDGDGKAEIITGPGAGGGPHLKVWKAGQVIAETYAFDPRYNGGIAVAAGDLDHDGKADIVVSPQTGGPVRTRLLSGNLTPIQDFWVTADGYRGGSSVAMRDIDGDGAVEALVSLRNNGRAKVLSLRPSGIPGDALVPDASVPEGVYVG